MKDEMTGPSLCQHCGNETFFKSKGGYSYQDKEYDWVGENEAIVKAYTDISYHLVECQTCHEPTLKLVYQWYGRMNDGYGGGLSDSTSGHFEPYDIPPTEKILYPETEIQFGDLPNGIMKRYKEALKVYHKSPPAFAVMAGRTLEAVCNHEGAQGKDLATKLKILADKNRIPQPLADMALHLRQLRNLGAHDDADDDVTKKDVPIILDFLKVILEYLYIAPMKLKVVQERAKHTTDD